MDGNKPQRRLAAILAADVVGYSRMMGRDEAGTLARLKRFESDAIEPSVSSHSGRIVKRMGDGYLVEFQSVVSAVDCAIDWQTRAAGSIPFRIGINLGDVIVEDDDLFGDGVNLAARLEAIADPGGICLSEDAWRQSKGKVDAQFEDLGSKQLKNISEPLRVYRLLFGAAPLPETVQEASASASARFSWKGPAIMLAPFRHLGSSGEAEMLASGLTETLAAALAHFEEFELIDPGRARQTIDAAGAREAGRQLGAGYTLEGSVQVALQKVRIGVQLIDVDSGKRVWSDTLDRSLDDVFALQDDITAFVASTMGDAVGEEQAKAISGKPLAALTHQELMVRGIQLLHRANPKDNETARACFETVRQTDPDGIFPTLCLCWTYAMELASGWPPTREDALAFSLGEIRALMARHPRSAHVHRLLSRLLFYNGDHDQGLAHAERAYALNPYHSDMMMALGMAHLWNGQADEARVQLERAFATNAYAPDVFKRYLSLAYFLNDRADEGLKVLNSSDGGMSAARLYRILNLVGSDRVAEAQREARILLDETPEMTLERVQIVGSFRREEERERLRSALRKAGLPE